MSHVHFTEEQLQTLALDRRNTSDCPKCQAQLSAYQLLYGHLVETEIAMIDIDAMVLDHIPDYQAIEPEDTRLWYTVLAGGIVLLVFGAAALWGAIHWIFNDIRPLVIITGLTLVFGILVLQLGELYTRYRKKFSALQPNLSSTVSS